MQKLKSTVVYPFLLSIFEDCYLYKNISNEELKLALDVVISYVLRRLICDLPTNALNKVFASLAKEITKDKYKDLDLNKKISIVLINKKGKVAFPNNILLRESFINKDFYHFKQGRFILEEIELNKSKEKVKLEETTIEHVMPQTLTPKWQVDLGKKYKDIHERNINKIGNLTLTGYNSELSNKSFSEKKELLTNSNINLNRDFSNYDIWNEVGIEKRGNSLFESAIEIWRYPSIEERYISNDIDTGEFEIMDDIDVTGRSPYEIQICGSKYSVNSWREFFTCICTVMHEYDSQIFKTLIKHNDFKGRKKRIITEDSSNLIKAAEIADGIYIEKNLSANDALNYSKLVIEKYDGMENEIVYKIK